MAETRQESSKTSPSIPRFDLVLPGEHSLKTEEVVDTEVKQAEHMMVGSPLDGTDLKDLEGPPVDFPSMTSSTFYPNSNNPSIHCPNTQSNSTPLTGNIEGSWTNFGFIEQILGEGLFSESIDFFDLRADQSICMLQNGRKVSTPLKEKKSALKIRTFSEVVECELEEIQKIENGWFVIGAQKQNIHLLFSLTEDKKVLSSFCMAVERNTSFRKCHQLCAEWLQKQLSSQATDFSCFISESGRFPCSDDEISKDFKDFDHICIVKKILVTVKIVLRLNTRTEKSFFIECHDTACVQELKEQFCAVYQEEEKTIVDASCVWLLHKDKVPADEQVLRNLWYIQGDESFDFEELDFDAKHTFYAFIHPHGSIPVKLNYKSGIKKFMKSECTIIVSSYETVDSLRNEIAKVTHTNPMSFKLLVNGKKIEAETDLWPIIQSHSNCTIVVEQSAKIQIDVVTSTGSCPEGVNQKVLISRFKYEKVDTLKKEVCDQLKMPLRCIDLYHNDNRLKDHESLRSSRLRNKDQVKAVVLRNRIWLKMRMVRWKSKWVNIEVDDQTLTTVAQLKAFALSQLNKIATESPDILDSNQECSNEFPREIIAIYKGNVLGDQENLHSAGVNMNDTIVLVEYEKRCFTATVGEIPIFFCKEGCSQTQRVIAMCNGKIYFFAHESLIGSEKGSQCKLFYQQSHSLPAQPGLRLCPDELRPHIPVSPSSPAFSSALQNTDICTMCKSKSMPLFMSAVNSPVSMPQFQSSSVNKNKAFPHFVDNPCLCGLNGISTSTPNSQNVEDSQPQTETYSSLSVMPVSRRHRHSSSPNDKEHYPGTDDENETRKFQTRNRIYGDSSGYLTEPVAKRGKQKLHHRELCVSYTETDGHGKTIRNEKLTMEKHVDKEYLETSASDSSFTLSSFIGMLSKDETNNNSRQAVMSSSSSDIGFICSSTDNTYFYVSQEIIRKVAESLEETERSQFFISLGFTFQEIKSIDYTLQGHGSFDRNFQCLEKWCKKTRHFNAISDLKKALEGIHRQDVLEDIEKILSRQVNEV